MRCEGVMDLILKERLHSSPTLNQQGAGLFQEAAGQALRSPKGDELGLGRGSPQFCCPSANHCASFIAGCYSRGPALNHHHQQVLATLPFELRSKILRHLYTGVIARVPLLQTMAHDDVFLTDVCVRLQQYTCSHNSFVYQRGALLVI